MIGNGRKERKLFCWTGWSVP